MTLFVFAGEQSADTHGAALLAALKAKNPHLHVSGVGGPQMRAKGMDCLLPMEEFQVMGFSDVFKALPRLRRHFKAIQKEILATSPQAVLLIDYPDFNLRMAKSLRRRGYRGKLIHFICPTVWAWRKKRAKSMAATLDLLLTIFPFEGDFFKDTPLKVTYVGNPSLEKVRQHTYDPHWKKHHALPDNRPILALFPGSRHGEIERNLPLMLEAVKPFSHMSIAISLANPKLIPAIHALCRKSSLTNLFLIPEKHTYELMKESTAALATSGTVTLELALHQTPTVVVYRLSPLNYFFAKHIFRISLPHYCIVNILLKKTLFPELIHDDFTPQNATDALLPLLDNEEVRKECLSLLPLLGIDKHPSLQAAMALSTFLTCS